MSRIFVDTNLLVHAMDDDSPNRDSARRIWGQLINLQDYPVISTQVLQEYYNTLTRKLGFKPEDAEGKLKRLEGVETMQITRDIIFQATALHRSASVSFWDALIIACAASAHCAELWTEDMQDGRKFGDVEIVNPFVRR